MYTDTDLLHTCTKEFTCTCTCTKNFDKKQIQLTFTKLQSSCITLAFNLKKRQEHFKTDPSPKLYIHFVPRSVYSMIRSLQDQIIPHNQDYGFPKSNDSVQIRPNRSVLFEIRWRVAYDMTP